MSERRNISGKAAVAAVGLLAMVGASGCGNVPAPGGYGAGPASYGSYHSPAAYGPLAGGVSSPYAGAATAAPGPIAAGYAPGMAPFPPAAAPMPQPVLPPPDLRAAPTGPVAPGASPLPWLEGAALASDPAAAPVPAVEPLPPAPPAPAAEPPPPAPPAPAAFVPDPPATGSGSLFDLTPPAEAPAPAPVAEAPAPAPVPAPAPAPATVEEAEPAEPDADAARDQAARLWYAEHVRDAVRRYDRARRDRGFFRRVNERRHASEFSRALAAGIRADRAGFEAFSAAVLASGLRSQYNKALRAFTGRVRIRTSQRRGRAVGRHVTAEETQVRLDAKTRQTVTTYKYRGVGLDEWDRRFVRDVLPVMRGLPGVFPGVSA